jgi:hypothetical protein
VLFVSPCRDAKRLAVHYHNAESLGDFVVPTGPTSRRQYFAFKLSGPRQQIGPLSPC